MRLEISNTNTKLLLYIRNLLDCGEINPNTRSSNKHKIGYKLTFKSIVIKRILLEIKDFLVIKKNQAELLLEFIETLKKDRTKRIMLTLDEVFKKELIYEELRELNKRGV